MPNERDEENQLLPAKAVIKATSVSSGRMLVSVIVFIGFIIACNQLSNIRDDSNDDRHLLAESSELSWDDVFGPLIQRDPQPATHLWHIRTDKGVSIKASNGKYLEWNQNDDSITATADSNALPNSRWTVSFETIFLTGQEVVRVKNEGKLLTPHPNQDVFVRFDGFVPNAHQVDCIGTGKDWCWMVMDEIGDGLVQLRQWALPANYLCIDPATNKAKSTAQLTVHAQFEFALSIGDQDDQMMQSVQSDDVPNPALLAEQEVKEMYQKLETIGDKTAMKRFKTWLWAMTNQKEGLVEMDSIWDAAKNYLEPLTRISLSRAVGDINHTMLKEGTKWKFESIEQKASGHTDWIFGMRPIKEEYFEGKTYEVVVNDEEDGRRFIVLRSDDNHVFEINYQSPD